MYTIRYSENDGLIEGKQPAQRWLSQLSDVFADPAAYAGEVQKADRLVYYVTSVEPSQGDGQLHYGLGVVLPGKVGDEYYLTRGHLHAWRDAAEVYICLRGQGLMLLEDERTGECQAVEMAAERAIYVPGYTAHRTVNTGTAPLIFWGIYPAAAGHDYQSIQQKNFQKVVICRDGKPVVMDRTKYLQILTGRQS